MIAEAKDHLLETVERWLASGCSLDTAELNALRAFGSAEDVSGAYMSGGKGRISRPCRITRLCGLVAIAAGVCWIAITAVWFGSFYRPSSWWGQLGYLGLLLAPIAGVLTLVAACGFGLRIGRPFHPGSIAALVPAVLGLFATLIVPESVPIWPTAFGLTSIILAWSYRPTGTIHYAASTRAILAGWWLLTAPMQVAVHVGSAFPQRWAGFTHTMWLAGLCLFGIGLVKLGHCLATESSAPTTVARIA